VQETPPYPLVLCLFMFLSSSSGDVGAASEHIRPRSVVFALDYASLASSSSSLPCLFFLFFADSSDLGRSAAMAVCGSHYARRRADLETR